MTRLFHHLYSLAFVLALTLGTAWAADETMRVMTPRDLARVQWVDHKPLQPEVATCHKGEEDCNPEQQTHYSTV